MRFAKLGLLLALAGCNAILGTQPPAQTGGAGGTGGQGGEAGEGGGGTSGTPCPNGVSDCPGPAASSCGQPTCTAGLCALILVADGTPLPAMEQVDGDCATLVCDGAGDVRVTPSDDPDDDGNPCTLEECVDGTTETTPQNGMVVCYTGPAPTLGVGPCKSGMQQCNSGTPTGACVGEFVPQTEDCDASMVDEDCDGMANEEGGSCVCVPNADSPCYEGPPGTQDVGICSSGMHTCSLDGLGYGACTNDVFPLPDELCDGGGSLEDENCDGQVDEGCVCEPNAVVGCAYSGPPGTENVGVCVAGSRTCDATGKGFLAPCAGEVVPSLYDSCLTPADEDCSGSAAACTGQWLLSVGDSYEWDEWTGRVLSVAADGTSVLLTHTSNDTAVLRKYDAAGTLLWTKSIIGTPGYAPIGMAVARDSAGNILLTGYTYAPTNFGCGLLTPTYNGQYYNADVFVAKFDPNGNCAWSKLYDSGIAEPNRYHYGRGIAVDGANNVIVVGRLDAVAIGLGGASLAPGPGCNIDSDAFVLKLDPSGNHVFSKRFDSVPTGCYNNYYSRVATDGAGNIYALGSESRIFKYDPSGNALTSWAVGGDRALYVTSSGTVAAAGGGGVGLYTSAGAQIWLKGPGNPTQVAIDSSGNVWALQAGGDNVLRFDAAGNVTFAEAFSFGNPNHKLYDLGVDGQGGVVFTGWTVGASVSVAQLSTNVNAMFIGKLLVP